MFFGFCSLLISRKRREWGYLPLAYFLSSN
jgi:hypothetical protein